MQQEVTGRLHEAFFRMAICLLATFPLLAAMACGGSDEDAEEPILPPAIQETSIELPDIENEVDAIDHELAALDVCKNKDLLKFIEILQDACSSESCDFSELEKIDHDIEKSVLLETLRNPYLRPVHLFFPVDLFKLDDVIDWESTKSSQVASISHLDNTDNTIIFVIGKASPTGLVDYDRSLSYSRMQSVLRHLKNNLRVECREFRVGYFGHEVLQFDVSDAHMLSIAEKDFRGDVDTLNQAVHVFAYPCANLLPE